tara:strand:- start:220 stop:663 length:444 start_codon:yes stop_codon:yes gene_type:complete
MKKLILPLVIVLLLMVLVVSSFQPDEQSSPSDTIQENQILITDEGVFIQIQDAIWVQYSNTDSMDPLIDTTANGIEILVTEEVNLEVGDIVSYDAEWNDNLVSHRIIDSGTDSQGEYYILKGDNNLTQDPNKVRRDQIKYKLVAIVY